MTNPTKAIIFKAIEQRIYECNTFTYALISEWANSKLGIDEVEDRCVDRTIQRLRRNGKIAFIRRGKQVVWSVVQ